MESLGRDVRYALRRLLRTPGFTLAALLTLALGIGANSALFSVLDAVVLQPLPFREPDRLYALWSRHTSTERYPFQLPEYCDYRDQNQTLEATAAIAVWSANLAGDGPTERLTGVRVSANLFELLGTRPALGRTLRPEDDVPGQEKVVVLSHGLWRRRFGGDPGVLGSSLRINGEPYEVVGVLGPRFLFPLRDVELAVPLAPEKDPWRLNRDSTSFLRVLARARPGVTPAQIASDLDAIGRRLRQQFPESYARKQGVTLLPLGEELTRGVRPALWMLQGAVAVLLLIACVNLANLMLVRGSERRRELAIRSALGAGHARLARELLVESVLLACAGGALGLLLAWAAVPALVALSPDGLPRATEIGLQLPVLAFTLGVSLLAGLGFGLLPALRAMRVDANVDLRGEGRAATGSASRGRLRGALVAAQVALMCVLLAGAALLQKSFREVLRVDPGFDEGVLVARLSLPRKDYSSLAAISAFYRELEARVATLPGVVSVAAVNHVPLNGALASADYRVEGQPAAGEQLPTALYRMATPAYFSTLGVPLIAGRAFSDDDREDGERVAIVSLALVRRSFGDRNPLGEHLLVKDNPEGFRSLRIVGVVGDLRHGSLEAAPEPHLFVPYHQTHPQLLIWLAQTQHLVVRTVGDPSALFGAVRRELRAVDPNVASAEPRTSGSYVQAASASRRFSLDLLWAFAGIALALAMIGTYAVAAYDVGQRARETGVRLALGASPGEILALVLRQGARRAVAGLVPGLLAAFAAARALRSQLYGVEAGDLPTYALVAGVLALVTLSACAIPAWRASRVSPMLALHLE